MYRETSVSWERTYISSQYLYMTLYSACTRPFITLPVWMCPCGVYPAAGYRTLTQDEEDFDKFLESVKAQQLSLSTKGITLTDSYSSIHNVSTYILYTRTCVVCGVPFIIVEPFCILANFHIALWQNVLTVYIAFERTKQKNERS